MTQKGGELGAVNPAIPTVGDKKEDHPLLLMVGSCHFWGGWEFKARTKENQGLGLSLDLSLSSLEPRLESGGQGIQEKFTEAWGRDETSVEGFMVFEAWKGAGRGGPPKAAGEEQGGASH